MLLFAKPSTYLEIWKMCVLHPLVILLKQPHISLGLCVTAFAINSGHGCSCFKELHKGAGLIAHSPYSKNTILESNLRHHTAWHNNFLSLTVLLWEQTIGDSYNVVNKASDGVDCGYYVDSHSRQYLVRKCKIHGSKLRMYQRS